ncbi:hypothetical protein BWZ22_04675 [Seonamhaeicola sp. S2-3]|uniref:DUF4260 domain-containing protein n=1 Tax=Seonamhaeicola sp. S2-3 TaxID=1936081 RepID=UPI000972CA23|nr:DUF4260 domain-containing protein [Seonamhaeicola sp. S2-3]APY10572.1 hypothetical protein BWZ22_04675 [Seonamhaeicola sp. S2-3]
MEKLLKIEELLMFVLGIYLFSNLDFNWWWFLALILTPDIGMLGYLVNSKIGAIVYNLFHHKGLAIIVYLLGAYSNNQTLQLVGIVLFSHASLDRIFGYGLKYSNAFNNTHLGQIGKK